MSYAGKEDIDQGAYEIYAMSLLLAYRIYEYLRIYHEI